MQFEHDICRRYFQKLPEIILSTLYNIHGVLNNNYIPHVYFLLPSKSTNCYTDAFQRLVEECRKMTCNSTQFECGF